MTNVTSFDLNLEARRPYRPPFIEHLVLDTPQINRSSKHYDTLNIRQLCLFASVGHQRKVTKERSLKVCVI